MSTLIQRLEAEEAAIMQRVRTAAIWLVSHVNTAQKDLAAMEAADPAVAAAVTLATSEIAHVEASNPALAAAVVGTQDVLDEARKIAASVPPAPPAAA